MYQIPNIVKNIEIYSHYIKCQFISESWAFKTCMQPHFDTDIENYQIVE